MYGVWYGSVLGERWSRKDERKEGEGDEERKGKKKMGRGEGRRERERSEREKKWKGKKRDKEEGRKELRESLCIGKERRKKGKTEN